MEILKYNDVRNNQNEFFRRKIAVVDDEKINISVLSQILEDRYEVMASKNGKDFIDLLYNLDSLPDLILLDLYMPEMDGLEVLKKLKSNAFTRDVPVIMITCADDEQSELAGFAAGAADYIKKPFSVPIVRARVKNQLDILFYIREIKKMSLFDQLTGLANRRYFDKHFEFEWSRTIREKQPISLLFIDIDHFKSLNDAYGHGTGDTFLKNIALAIQNSVKRATDFCARFGGEEFCVILPNTLPQNAVIIAERIREEIFRITIPARNIRTEEESIIGTSVSIGISARTPHPTPHDLPLEFIREADSNLYKAKQTGRNKVVYEESIFKNN